MASTVKCFSGDQEVSYEGILSNKVFDEQFPGVKGIRYDSFNKFIGKDTEGNIYPITRRIFFKKNPSLHKCDARCMNAKGHNCECSCMGKNHGMNG